MPDLTLSQVTFKELRRTCDERLRLPQPSHKTVTCGSFLAVDQRCTRAARAHEVAGLCERAVVLAAPRRRAGASG